jgi:branched-chain amino acid transport system permease protein
LTEIEVFFQTTTDAVTLSVVYMLFASGLTLAFGIMRLFNFAHGTIYVLGAYITFFVLRALGWNLASYSVAIVAGTLAAAAFGMLVERFLFRRFAGTLIPQIVISLGLAISIEAIYLLAFGEKERGIPSIIAGTVAVGKVAIPSSRLFITLVGLAVMIGLFLLLKRTKMGHFVRAVMQDGGAARLYGVNTGTVSMSFFALSCALAGLCGALLGPVYGSITPYMGSSVLLIAVIVVTIGGLGSIPGSILGSVIIGFIYSFVGTYVSGPMSLLAGFVALYAILIFRPLGLFGHPGI